VSSRTITPGTWGVEGLRKQLADPLYRNGYALVANTGATGISGLIYWVLVARLYPTEVVGRATAAYAAMNLLAGFTALPRQDGNQNGWIKDFAFCASDDGTNWGEPVVKGIFTADDKLKTVEFAAPVTAKFVKLVALSGYADGPWASLAEFNVIKAGQ